MLFYHLVDSVTAGTTDTDNLDDCQEVINQWI
jgi:hypothetical protein